MDPGSAFRFRINIISEILVISQSNFGNKYSFSLTILDKKWRSNFGENSLKSFWNIYPCWAGFHQFYLELPWCSAIHILASLPTFYMKYALCAQNNRIPARMWRFVRSGFWEWWRVGGGKEPARYVITAASVSSVLSGGHKFWHRYYTPHPRALLTLIGRA